jgi:hypothetical protein
LFPALASCAGSRQQVGSASASAMVLRLIFIFASAKKPPDFSPLIMKGKLILMKNQTRFNRRSLLGSGSV